MAPPARSESTRDVSPDTKSGTQSKLMPNEVARIEIESSFGTGSVGEASICKVVSGDLAERDPSSLVVQQHSYAAPLK